MALVIAPYHAAMRIGQGYEQYCFLKFLTSIASIPIHMKFVFKVQLLLIQTIREAITTLRVKINKSVR
jgi:hypothetical protein